MQTIFDSTAKSRWYFRASVIACLLLIFFVSDRFFDRLQLKHDGSYTLRFSPPLPPETLVQYKLAKDPEIERVLVVGFFNDWDENNVHYALERIDSGTWEKKLTFSPGDNQYKFVIYIKGNENPVWIYDHANPHRVQDSHGDYNSVAKIPDITYMRFAFNFALFSGLLFLLIYYVAEPILYWLLHRKLSIRIKLTLSLTFVAVISNVLYISIHYAESRELVKQGIIDSIHWTHLILESKDIDFHNLNNEKDNIQAAIHDIFWNAKVRVEKQSNSPSQITLSDIALFDKDLQLITLNHREQNADLQLERAQSYGYPDTRSYFTEGVLSQALNIAKAQQINETIFTHPGKNVLTNETKKNKFARLFLGFSNFIHPIFYDGKIVGYYAGSIQVKLYGSELRQFLYFELLLLFVFSALTFLILSNIGYVITNNLDQLAQWTKRIIQGNFGEEVILDSKDEVQELAENFGKMHRALESSFKEIEEKSKQLEIEAYVDPLTSLPNRKRMHIDIQEEEIFSLIVFNVDSFKGLNDFFGLEVGDAVLIELANRFQEKIGTKQNLYRVGSDEFIVTVGQDMTHPELETLANDFLDSVSDHPFRINRHEIYVSTTAGVAVRKRMSSTKSLQSKAELALREAKTEMIRMRFYDSSMESYQEFENNMSWTTRLRQAIDDDRIVPFYQPIVNNKTNKIEKYECLVRLIEKDGSVVSPAHFLDISKRSRFYPFITQIMLSKAFAKFRDLPYEFTINLSIEDILDSRTHKNIVYLLENNPSIAHRVTFEIVESEEIKNYEIVRKFIRTAKHYQCKIAIDDFGAGYSNFAHILSLNVDYLKIDGSLIKNLGSNENMQTITQTIVDFSTKMGIETIAEFVHSEEVLSKTKELGITFSQGFYLGEPAAEPAKLLQVS